MSRKNNRFLSWLNGEEDPYIGKVEMKPQKEFQEKESTIRERMLERQQILDQVYDLKKNKELKYMNLLYRIAAIIFCVVFVAVLIYAVSYLPPFGGADNPGSNEVTQRYIESGLQETGAVNIVTGMILDYRAFDRWESPMCSLLPPLRC